MQSKRVAIISSCILLALLIHNVACFEMAKEPFRHIENKNVKKWKNCSTLIPPAELENPPPYYGFACDEVYIEYLIPEIFKNRRGKVDIAYQAFVTPDQLCSYSFWDYAENVTGISDENCWTYYCENDFPLDADPWFYLDAWNYCTYCKQAPAREEFVYSVANGTCRGLQQVIDPLRTYTHCNKNSWKHYSRNIMNDGFPLMDTYVSSQLGKPSYYCYCSFWDRFGYKCNGNTAFLEPYDIYAEAEIIIVFFFLLSVINFICCTIPLAGKSIRIFRASATNSEAMRNIPHKRIAVHVLTSLSMIFEILAFIIQFFFPFSKLNTYLFFAAIYDAFLVVVEGCLFAALFTYISIWVNLMHKANAPNPDDPAPWYLQLLPVPVYLLTFLECVVIIIVSLYYSYATGQLSHNAWLYTNTTIYLVWIASMIVAWISMTVYGVRLYRMLSQVQKVNPINLKFTRLLVAFSLIGVAYIIFRVYISATNISKYETVTFFIRMRHTILAMILFAFCVTLITAVYNEEDTKEVYPCLAPVFAKLSREEQNE